MAPGRHFTLKMDLGVPDSNVCGDCVSSKWIMSLSIQLYKTPRMTSSGGVGSRKVGIVHCRTVGIVLV